MSIFRIFGILWELKVISQACFSFSCNKKTKKMKQSIHPPSFVRPIEKLRNFYFLIVPIFFILIEWSTSQPFLMTLLEI